MTVHWIDFRDTHDNWLLFRYDPKRRLVSIQRRGRKMTFDLSECEDIKIIKEAARPLDKAE
jgi:hypothetical protein